MIRVVMACALALAALAAPARAAEPFQMASVDQVEKLIGKGNVYVFDVNSQERFEQGHLPGAKHVSKKTLAGSLPPNKDATLVFYCMNPH